MELLREKASGVLDHGLIGAGSAGCERQLMPMSSDHDPRGLPTGFRARWLGLSSLSRILLTLSVLATLAIVVIILFFVYLLIGAYSGGSNPTSVNGVLFPIALLFLGIVGFPSTLVCVLLWVGYAISRRRDARRGEPAGRWPAG
jgi:hypothetical protein